MEQKQETITKLLNSKNIIRILALVAEICFFTPLCTVSCSNHVLSITGLKSTFGFSILDQRINGNLATGLLFIIPFIILLVLSIRKFIRYSTTYALVSLLGIVNALLLLLYKLQVVKQLMQQKATGVSFSGTYYLDLSVSIAIAVLSFATYYFIRQNLLFNPFHFHSFYPNKTSLRYCTSCHSILQENDIFCHRCGIKCEQNNRFLEQRKCYPCTNCGTNIPSKVPFCPNCGVKQ